MLEALRKKLAGSNQQEQLEEGQTLKSQKGFAIDVVSLEQMNELSTQLAELAGTVEELNSVIATKDALLAELNGKLEQLSGYAAEAEARAEAIAAEAKAKEEAERKQMLADVIGADNPGFDSTYSAIASLDAASFSVVVEGFKASFAKEAESPMFNEVGVAGEADVKEESSALNIRNYISVKKGK